MKFLRGTMLGAAAGGLYGASDGGGWMGAMGGAIGGGLAGGAGVAMGRKFLGARGGIAGLARRSLGQGVRGAQWGAGKFSNAISTSNRVITNKGLQYAHGGLMGGAIGLQMASKFIGRNANAVNKYGGYALATIGAGAAAHIGSSVLKSNRGY